MDIKDLLVLRLDNKSTLLSLLQDHKAELQTDREQGGQQADPAPRKGEDQHFLGQLALHSRRTRPSVRLSVQQGVAGKSGLPAPARSDGAVEGLCRAVSRETAEGTAGLLAGPGPEVPPTGEGGQGLGGHFGHRRHQADRAGQPQEGLRLSRQSRVHLAQCPTPLGQRSPVQQGQQGTRLPHVLAQYETQDHYWPDLFGPADLRAGALVLLSLYNVSALFRELPAQIINLSLQFHYKMQGASQESLIKRLLEECEAEQKPKEPQPEKRHKSCKENQDIKQFWSHVNLQYFRPVDKAEPARLVQQLHSDWSVLNSHSRQQEEVYHRVVRYECLAKNKMYDPHLLKQQQHNLGKHLQLTRLAQDILASSPSDGKLHKQVCRIQREKYFIINEYIDHAQYLQQESKLLDKQFRRLQQVQLQCSFQEENLIQRIIKEKTDKLGNLQQKLKCRFLQLQIKVEQEVSAKELTISVSPRSYQMMYKRQAFYDNRKLKAIRADMHNIQLEYLLGEISRLEEKQLVDSIGFVHGVEGDQLKVSFEKNTFQGEWLMEGRRLQRLNRHRDNSLFGMYSLAQKSLYSYTSQNIFGFHLAHSRLSPIKPLNPPVCSSLQSIQEYGHLAQPLDFDICHHCKHYYHTRYLFRCNYKSSKMGLPVYHSKLYEMHSTQLAKHKKMRISQRKTLVCHRRFCAHCIKQNYSNEVAEVARDPNWICMFCQGICFCATCLRQDMIVKLKNQYIAMGGALPRLEAIPTLRSVLQAEEKTESGPKRVRRAIAKRTTRLVGKSRRQSARRRASLNTID